VRDANGKATSNIFDAHSHGTHVSGTIAAKQNNKIGIAGIASNVRIMGIRTVPNNSDETDIDVAEAFIYAAKNGAKIINCSFGKSKNEGKNLIPDTLKYIQDNYGVLVIAAAGNSSDDIDKKPTFPANHLNENLLIVASTQNNGGMSGFSNYGKINVDVSAPGSSIYSTVPNGRYASMSGTSMASPTTAGVAAEILSHFPNLTPLQLKQVLMDSVTKVERFKNKIVSGGRIDLLLALDLARTIK
jgi:subtilisin family serine protease